MAGRDHPRFAAAIRRREPRWPIASLARTARWWALPLAAGAAASLAIVASTVRAIHAGWVPAGDDGIIATRGWDVLTAHTPLVGQYSEAGPVVHGVLADERRVQIGRAHV